MEIKEVVNEKYGQAALRVHSGGSSCCGVSAAIEDCDAITSNLYDASQTGTLPRRAVLASLGCVNPTALAQLNAGETVLDLGSDGGIDMLLSARRVGSTGRAIGLDVTDEMLAMAREDQRKAGVIDVVLSNFVINLSADEDRVLREAFRVSEPSGRFAVSNAVTRGDVPVEVRQNMLLWVGYLAGALQDWEDVAKLVKVGFDDIDIEPTRVWSIEDARTVLTGQGVDVDAMASAVDGKFISAFIRATKPVSCCAPGCCV